VNADRVIAITGANGYVGSIIAGALEHEATIIELVRSPRTSRQFQWSFDAPAEAIASELKARGVTDLVHAAWDMKANSAEEVERRCVEGSIQLFHAARDAGVRKTIFISTISAFADARATYGKTKYKVERAVLEAGGIALRLGLVYGKNSGGVFGNLRAAVRKSRIVPLIGSGMAKQYLLNERTLVTAVRRAVSGDFDDEFSPITLAHPKPCTFRDLVASIASEEHRSVVLVPIPWKLLYLGLASAERIGLKLDFRSDSVLSFIYQNPSPDFSALVKYKIETEELPLTGPRTGFSSDDVRPSAG
jgi:nucleoside-diphosphate-sugar epimerase